MSTRRNATVMALLVTAALATAEAMAQQALTWTNATGTATWNTTDPNWVGGGLFTDGTNVIFSSVQDKRAPKTIYIGSGGGTPIDVGPGTVTWLDSGTWLMSGGGITNRASLTVSWDANVIFTNYTADVLTFTGGTTIATGWLTFAPTAPGTYRFGRGPIIASQRGTYVGLKFTPTVPGCILTNDFIVPSVGNNAPIGGAYWYGTINGGKILGTITMGGPISMNPIGGPAASNRLDATLLLTGDRTLIVPNSSFVHGAVDGGGVHTFSINAAFSSDPWTDGFTLIMDDPPTSAPVWNIGAFTKLEGGNAIFRNYRDLGNALNLRTGGVILGGLAAPTNHIRDTAAVNLQGGKLLLRRDGAASQTETVGSVNLQWGYSELRLAPANGATYTLASAAALSRTNFATALIAANDLGGSGAAAGSGRVTFPSAPAMIGGGGGAGSKNISIVPFLIGGLTTDNATILTGDAGSTLVTYDTATNSLRNLNTATEFKTALAGAASDENVRLTTNETLTADAAVNALVMDAATQGRTLDGPHTLTLNSGVLLARGGNGISNAITVAALDFAGREGVVSVVESSPNHSYGNTWLVIKSVIQNGGLTKSGFGRLDLRGDSAFTGPFVVNNGKGGVNKDEGVFLYGTLATTNVQLYGGGTWLQANDRLPAGITPLVDSRATLYLNNKTQMLANVRSGPNGGGKVDVGTLGQLTFNPSADVTESDAFTGTITAGTVVKAGTNLMTIGGGLAPAALRLQQGVLRRTLASGSGGVAKTYLEGGIYELAVNTRDWAYNNQYVFGPGGGGWSSKGAAANLVTIYGGNTAQQWGVSAGFIADGDPLLFNSVYADGCIRYESPINLGSTAGTPMLREIRVADNPASTADYAYVQGVISGTAADKTLWKTGDGLLQLNTGNSFAGGMRISGGLVQVGNLDNSFGVAPASPTVNVTLDGGGLVFGAAVTLNANRMMTLNAGKTAILDTVTGTVNLQGKLTGGTGGASLVKRGAGTLTLSGANDYVAANTISNGTVIANNATALGANGNPLALAAPATLNMNGQSLAVGPLNGAAGALIGNTASGTATNTLTLDFDTVTAVYDGQLNNGATRKTALTKLGSGIEVLNGDNTYTGPTTVNGGALYLNGANATLAVSVGAGATFGGAGTIAGNVTVASNGTLAPGAPDAAGTLRIDGSLTLAAGARIASKAGGGAIDLASVGGTLTVPATGTVTITYLGGGWPAETPLITANALTGTTGRTLTGWTVITPEGVSGTVGVSGTSLVFRRTQGTVLLLR